MSPKLESIDENRSELRSKLMLLIQKVESVVIMDAHLTQSAINLISAYSGFDSTPKPVVSVENEYRVPRPDIHFCWGADFKGKFNEYDSSPWLAKSVESLKAGENIVITTDKKDMAHALDACFKLQGFKGLVISSETKKTPETKDSVAAFCANPDKEILDNQYQYLIMTPAIDSGLSIDLKGYFTSGFGIYDQIIGVMAQMQQILRVRDVDCPRYIFARPYPYRSKSEANQDMEEKLDAIDSLVMDSLVMDRGLTEEETEANRRFFVGNFPREDYDYNELLIRDLKAERGHPRASFTHLAETTGYKIIDYKHLPSMKALQAELKAATKKYKEDFALNVYYANSSKNWKEHNHYDTCRKLIEKAIPSVKDSYVTYFDGAQQGEEDGDFNDEDGYTTIPLWNLDLIKLLMFDEPDILIGLNRRVFVENPALLKKVKPTTKNIYSLAIQDAFDNNTLIAALIKLGVKELLELPEDERLDGSHPLVRKIITRWVKSKEIVACLGMRPSKDHPIASINRLLELVGEKPFARRSTRQDNNMVNYYVKGVRKGVEGANVAVLYEQIKVRLEGALSTTEEPLTKDEQALIVYWQEMEAMAKQINVRLGFDNE